MATVHESVRSAAATAGLVRDCVSGVYRGGRSGARELWSTVVPGDEAAIAPSFAGADTDYYEQAAAVDTYSDARRQHIDDYHDDMVQRAAAGTLSGKQYILAKEMRQIERFFDAEGYSMAEDAPLDGVRVLDAPCGDGCFSRALANWGADVISADRSQEMLQAAQDKEQQDAAINPLSDDAAGSIVYRQADVADLDVTDEVDYAVMWRSAHVIGDLAPPLQSLADAVGAQGAVLFDTFHERSGRRLYTPLLGMDSTLHSRGEVRDAAPPGARIDRQDSGFVLPYGAFRPLPPGHRWMEGNVRWNEAMEEKRPEYASVDFWRLST
ncbi:MAG: class I SAM-dependent methyltransferase [Candidatus Nanohaloarchaea archaeon]|nr:class I SAM-dependent methyltransferase [Candidatus Nanohaloarchaea archaeon]